MNQTFHAAGGTQTVFEVQQDNVPAAYRKAAENAFSGLPVFAHEHPDWIVTNPSQWSIFGRRRRRLVIKSVNPLAAGWLLQYRPRVIYLVRHPAAVALSYFKLGWWEALRGGWSEEECWRLHAEYQADVLRRTLHQLAGYADLCFVQYETLCTNPLQAFRELFLFVGLDWDRRMETIVGEHSSAGDRANPYDTMRDSRSMVDSWRDRLTRRQVDQIRAGYAPLDLPWYSSDQDW